MECVFAFVGVSLRTKPNDTDRPGTFRGPCDELRNLGAKRQKGRALRAAPRHGVGAKSYTRVGLHPVLAGSPLRDSDLLASNLPARGDVMSILWAILIGFVVGLIAKFLMPGRDGGGFILTALLGIVGAVAATFLGQAMGIYAAGQSAGFIGAVIGAIVVLFVYHMVRGRRRVV